MRASGNEQDINKLRPYGPLKSGGMKTLAYRDIRDPPYTTVSLDPETTCNLDQNICEPYNVLVQIRSTTSKTKRSIFTI